MFGVWYRGFDVVSGEGFVEIQALIIQRGFMGSYILE